MEIIGLILLIPVIIVVLIIFKFLGAFLSLIFDWATDGCGCIIGGIILVFLAAACIAVI